MRTTRRRPNDDDYEDRTTTGHKSLRLATMAGTLCSVHNPCALQFAEFVISRNKGAQQRI